jgi:hypothetical protein
MSGKFCSILDTSWLAMRGCRCRPSCRRPAWTRACRSAVTPCTNCRKYTDRTVQRQQTVGTWFEPLPRNVRSCRGQDRVLRVWRAWRVRAV